MSFTFARPRWLVPLVASALLLMPVSVASASADEPTWLEEHGPPASDTASDPWSDASPAERFGGASEDDLLDVERDDVIGMQSFSTSAAKAKLPGPAPILANGGGWGHGIGMSQYGAQAMAVAGRSYSDILTHYHVGTAVQQRAMPNDFRVGLRSTKGTAGGSLHFPRLTVKAENRPITWSSCTSSYGGCTTLVTQPAGETWVAGWTSGKLVLRNANSSIRHDLDDNHLRAQLGSGTTDRRVTIGEKGRSYQWGTLEVRRPASGSSGVRATIGFAGQFEKYVYGIAEVPFSWHANALRAQAVAARGYAVAGRSLLASCNCYVTDGTESQVYYGADRENGTNGSRWRNAVDTTAGRVVTHNGSPVATFYSSSHNKRSENIEDVWTNPQPYHRSVADPWSSDPRANNPNASWTGTIPNASLATRAGGGMQLVTYVEVLERTAGGTPRTIEVWGRSSSGNTVVRTLSGTGAPSEKTIGNILRGAYSLRSAQIDSLSPAPYEDTLARTYRSHVYDIAQLWRMGLTTGCGPTKYCPARNVTRGEMAAFLHRAAGEPIPPRRHSFPDVKTSDFYDTAVSWLLSQGITDGFGNTGTYRPDASVTRGQMVTFLWRMAGEPKPTRRHSFTDVSRNRYYDDAVSWAAQLGITDGWGNTGRFEPDRAVTRAQMASFLVRYIDKVH